MEKAGTTQCGLGVRYGKDFDPAMRFLAASQRRHRLKSILKLSVFAGICLTAAWTTFLWYRSNTERHKAASARLLDEVQLLRSQDPLIPLTMLLGIEAMKHNPYANFALNQFQLASLGMLPKSGHQLQHDGRVSLMVYSPDGTQLATASNDKTARLWNTETGKELQRLNHDGGVNAVTFSPDGRQLAMASDDKTARLWLWRPDQLCSRMQHNLTWDEWQKYLGNEPYRKTCEPLPVAPNYQGKGKQLVKEGKTAEAVRMIQQLNSADPALKLNQEQTLQEWTSQ